MTNEKEIARHQSSALSHLIHRKTAEEQADDEAYYSRHPVASSYVTMRFAFTQNDTFQRADGLSCSKEITTHKASLAGVAYLDKTADEKKDDDVYYTRHPVASSQETMRMISKDKNEELDVSTAKQRP